jgi:hypothetical protein
MPIEQPTGSSLQNPDVTSPRWAIDRSALADRNCAFSTSTVSSPKALEISAQAASKAIPMAFKVSGPKDAPSINSRASVWEHLAWRRHGLPQFKPRASRRAGLRAFAAHLASLTSC